MDTLYNNMLLFSQKVSICRRTESKLAKKLLELTACEAAKKAAEERAVSLQREMTEAREKQAHAEKRVRLLEDREAKVGAVVEELAGLKEELHKVCVGVGRALVSVASFEEMVVCYLINISPSLPPSLPPSLSLSLSPFTHAGRD